MIRKIIVICAFIITILTLSSTYATETINTGDTHIPSMTVDQLLIMMQSKQAKVDIIKKNNIQIENLKIDLKGQIIKAADKINSLKIEVSQEKIEITDQVLNELKQLLQFLQDSKTTLENDVEKISNEIESILDLISTKGMQLEQYDKLIEKQNEVIVKMKEIMNTVTKI